uniref:Uncharacterized protein n=1 Tax=Bionectria ochroleuca TaxID=29856 RepID=A0A8H7N1Z8_BIOOC
MASIGKAVTVSDYEMKSKEDESVPVADDKEMSVEGGEVEDSPFDEVRAIVPPVDDVDLPVNTFRAWFLGIVSTILFSGILQFFQLHSPPIFLASYLVIIITLPVGHFMARVLPTTTFSIFGHEVSLNPGPFNHKEHTITAIMTTLVSAFDNGSLASDIYVAFDKFLGIPISPGFRLMFLLTTQALSFGFVGIFHRFLVRPSVCIWPGALPTCSMIYAFHDPQFQNQVADGWKVNRMRFFWLAVVIAGSWQVVPSFLFTSLTTFAWITWIRQTMSRSTKSSGQPPAWTCCHLHWTGTKSRDTCPPRWWSHPGRSLMCWPAASYSSGSYLRRCTGRMCGTGDTSRSPPPPHSTTRAAATTPAES